VNLNADQLRAVEHPGGPLLVLAGPGTGKTGVLVARIAHLVANRGVRPDRILALTFSRRAADEMSERVKSRVPEAAFVETRTFHSFALSIVRRYASALGLRMAPEIMATGEQWALVSELLANESSEAWGLAPGTLARPATVREVYDLLLRCQEHLLEPEKMRTLGENTGLPYLVRAAGLLERYRLRLADLSEVDYEGVVQHALELLEEDSPVRERLISSYDYVLVDEFQDTNRSQLELVRALCQERNPTSSVLETMRRASTASTGRGWRTSASSRSTGLTRRRRNSGPTTGAPRHHPARRGRHRGGREPTQARRAMGCLDASRNSRLRGLREPA
jgi:superfamily I DNA/RNA helicase